MEPDRRRYHFGGWSQNSATVTYDEMAPGVEPFFLSELLTVKAGQTLSEVASTFDTFIRKVALKGKREISMKYCLLFH